MNLLPKMISVLSYSKYLNYLFSLSNCFSMHMNHRQVNHTHINHMRIILKLDLCHFFQIKIS